MTTFHASAKLVNCMDISEKFRIYKLRFSQYCVFFSSFLVKCLARIKYVALIFGHPSCRFFVFSYKCNSS
jgi:hypothetical protein